MSGNSFGRTIAKTRFSKIQHLRALFLHELNAQVRYDAAHTRRGSATYVLRHGRRDIGYGSVKDVTPRNGTVFEFYVVPTFRADALELLRMLIQMSEAKTLECQTNDLFYASLVRELSDDLVSDTILFAPDRFADLKSSTAVFRRRRRGDRVFPHQLEPDGDFVIDLRGDIVASGGFLLHYNKPFADVFMEVRPDARRQGHGSFLVQEIMTECFLSGRVPAARTGVDNVASRATLIRAGMKVCGEMLRAGASFGREGDD